MLRPDAGAILLGDDDITALDPETRVRRGLVRTFQINSLFPNLNALEAVTLAVCERDGIARTWRRPITSYRGRSTRPTRSSSRSCSAPLLPVSARARLRPAAPARDRARAGDPAEGAAARRAGRRRAARGERRAVRRRRQPVAATSRCCSSSTTWISCSASRAASSSWSAAAFSSKGAVRGSLRRRARARDLSGQAHMAEPLLELEDSAPATAMPSCSTTSRSRCPSRAASRCSAATASARARCSSPSWAIRRCAAAPSAGAARTSRARAASARAAPARLGRAGARDPR